ncbi:DNA-directed DNA polymerase, partial [[Eubacterium] cellulosolvens]
DINGETTPQGSEIRLWGVDDEGMDTLIVDRDVKPYFYALPKEDFSAETLSETLTSSKTYGDILNVSVEGKKLLSRRVKAVKITCGSTEMLEGIAKSLAKHRGVDQILGDDLRYSSLYLFDRDLTPCRWNEADVEELRFPEAPEDNAFLSIGSPRPIVLEGIPKLRILAFSAIAFAEKGSPHAAQDPVSMISVATCDGQVRSFVRSSMSDHDVIAEFTHFLEEFDPHVVAGFESNRTDWPYLIERAKISGTALAVGRLGSRPHTSVYGHISITGRASVDMFDFATELPEVKVKSLENVAAFLGIKLDATLPDELELAKIWKRPQDRPLLAKCSIARSQAILEITKRFLEFGMELSSLTCMPLDQVATAAVGHRVDSYLIKEAYRQGHLIPHRSEQPYLRYQGAIVLAPLQGLHENVVALDFASMYPNLMILYNLSPDTFVPKGQESSHESCWVIEGPGHRFRKTPPGLYKSALTNLISFRNDVKARLENDALSNGERRVLQERERAVKVITNACYGYAGWTGARWYVREVAESAAALGRKSITQVINRCEEIGLSVIYADTDAVFVTRDEDKVNSLLRWVNENLHMDIRPDKTYQRVLFTEAKKRYAGLLADGTLDIVGMEVVRGDWSEVARKVQERAIELVLREASPDKAKEYVLNAIDQLRRGNVSMQDLIIWKTLTKHIEEYKVRAPHVEAAKRYLSAGRELLPGDKIGYVITKKSGKLYEKAEPYFAVTADQVDAEYYVSSQIVPAAARILEVFNIGEDQLLLGRQRPLM